MRCSATETVLTHRMVRVFPVAYLTPTGTVVFLITTATIVNDGYRVPHPKGRDGALPALDVPVGILEVAKVACGFPPAQAAIGSTSALLTIIRVRSPPTLPLPTPDSRSPGTPWQISNITLNLGNSVVTSAKLSTGG